MLEQFNHIQEQRDRLQSQILVLEQQNQESLKELDGNALTKW